MPIETSVKVILGALAGGDSFEQIATNYEITTEDIRTCIEFARDEVDRQMYVPLSA